jgi:DNA-binding IclR family transcriptional regulator
LDKLANETVGYASLLVEESGTARAIYSIKGESLVEFKVDDGTQLHLGNTAPERTILANLPRGRVESILEERGVLRESAGDRPRRAVDAFERIRELGFAIDEESPIHGPNGVGVPSIDGRGNGRCGLSVYAPVGHV